MFNPIALRMKKMDDLFELGEDFIKNLYPETKNACISTWKHMVRSKYDEGQVQFRNSSWEGLTLLQSESQ